MSPGVGIFLVQSRTSRYNNCSTYLYSKQYRRTAVDFRAGLYDFLGNAYVPAHTNRRSTKRTRLHELKVSTSTLYTNAVGSGEVTYGWVTYNGQHSPLAVLGLCCLTTNLDVRVRAWSCCRYHTYVVAYPQPTRTVYLTF